MEIKAIKTEEAPMAVGPYSQGIAAGNLVFTAGEIPVNPADGSVPEDTLSDTLIRVYVLSDRQKRLESCVFVAGTVKRYISRRRQRRYSVQRSFS